MIGRGGATLGGARVAALEGTPPISDPGPALRVGRGVGFEAFDRPGDVESGGHFGRRVPEALGRGWPVARPGIRPVGVGL